MRQNFPSRRQGLSHQFEYEKVPFHVLGNRFENGDLGEIFIDAGKVGSAMYSIGKELAVVFSLARQFGVPLSLIREALPHGEDGSAAGPLGRALEMAEGT